MDNSRIQNVCIVILPSNYSEEKASIFGWYTCIPNNVISIYNTLIRVNIKVDVLNLEYEFHGRNAGINELKKQIEDHFKGKNYSHIIFPISISETLNEFASVNIGLLKRIVDEMDIFRDTELIFTGRVLNERSLRENICNEFTLIKTSYQEDHEIAKYISKKSDISLLPLEYGAKFEECFHLDFIFTLFPKERPVVIYGQKGCKFQCAFCERYLIWPSSDVYQLNLDETMKTIEYYIDKHQKKYFEILDPLFNSDRQYMHEFCKRVKKYNIKWHCEVKVELLNKDDLYLMKEAGCYEVLFGAESFEKTILKQYNKPLNFDKLLEMMDVCKELGINILLTFIAGLGQNVCDAYNHIYGTTKFLIEHNITQYAKCVPFYIYEGTRFYESKFGKETTSVFPKSYHPYEIIYMIDFITLFKNKCFDNYIELGGEKIYCYRELFEFMHRNNLYDRATAENIFSISKHTGYGEFLAYYFPYLERGQLISYINKFLANIESYTEVSLVDFRENLLEFDTPQLKEFIASYDGNIALT